MTQNFKMLIECNKDLNEIRAVLGALIQNYAQIKESIGEGENYSDEFLGKLRSAIFDIKIA